MTRQSRHILDDDRGFAMVYMALILTGVLLFSGLAVDTGRAYVVKAQLTKAVDGAALAAARSLNSGNPEKEASEIFKANFPKGYMGTTAVTDPATDDNFFTLTTVQATGANVVTVKASAKLPTTFMNLANVNEVTVSSEGEATRRMVDLSLVLDVSSSIGSRWGAVRDASRAFIDAFDEDADRVSLITYGNGAKVIDQMRSSRGFDKAKLKNDIPQSLPGGSTAMVEGLYRGWDELRTVPKTQQSGLRVIVLFTDGASNSVPGDFEAAPGLPRGLRTYDFPDRPNDEDQTHNNPRIQGLYDTSSGVASPSYDLQVAYWSDSTTLPNVKFLPLKSFHGYHRSSGIKTAFDLQTTQLKVNGVAQSARRGLRNKNASTGRYPADVWNINNAARNLIEIIANDARNDGSGAYPVRIYTIGMGGLVKLMLGTMPEQPEEILMRIANDKRSQDFNTQQLEGKYYYAQTEADVANAFQQLQNQIVRLSK